MITLVLISLNKFSMLINSIYIFYLQDKLQKIQNSCIRFIFNYRKYDHISHLFPQLNWFQLDKRRLFHLGCFIYDITFSKTPEYLYVLLKPTSIHHAYNTRSRLYINRFNTNYGSKAFVYFGCKFWNSLPII